MTSYDMRAYGLASTTPILALVDLPRIRERGGVIFLNVRANSRPAVATTIEGLINFLDTIDADPDLEESGDERDAGAPWGSLPRCVCGAARATRGLCQSLQAA